MLVTKYLDLSTGVIDFSKFRIDTTDLVHPFLAEVGGSVWSDSSVVEAAVFGRYMKIAVETPHDLTGWEIIPVFDCFKVQSQRVAFDDEPGLIAVHHFRVQSRDEP